MRLARLRVFAGPNGSGKSTLQKDFSKLYPVGSFVNADLIERSLRNKGYFDLDELSLKLTQKDLTDFLKSARAKSLLKKAKAKKGADISLKLVDNKIISKSHASYSYEGSLIAMFARHHLLHLGIDFCFETVMKHPSKIDEILDAKRFGYKTYLYFVSLPNG